MHNTVSALAPKTFDFSSVATVIAARQPTVHISHPSLSPNVHRQGFLSANRESVTSREEDASGLPDRLSGSSEPMLRSTTPSTSVAISSRSPTKHRFRTQAFEARRGCCGHCCPRYHSLWIHHDRADNLTNPSQKTSNESGICARRSMVAGNYSMTVTATRE
jgi:hypothetical protein